METKHFFHSFVPLIAFIAVLLTVSGCGGGSPPANLPSSEIPAVSAVTDASGVTLDGATDVDFSALHLAFAEAVDLALLSQPGVVTITCAGMPASVVQPGFQIRAADDDAADGIAGNQFTIDVVDGYKYQLLDCSLSIAATPPSASGSLAAKAAGAPAATATFTNKCARSSDFNAGDKETKCWTLGEPIPEARYPWELWTGPDGALENVLIFDLNAGALDWSASMTATTDAIIFPGKAVLVGDADVEMKMHVTDIANFNPPVIKFPSSVGMMLLNSAGSGYWIMLGNFDGASCIAFYIVNGLVETAGVSGNAGTCIGNEFYLRLRLTPSTGTAAGTAEAAWSPDDVLWTPFTASIGKGGADTLPNLQYHALQGEGRFGVIMVQADLVEIDPVTGQAKIDPVTGKPVLKVTAMPQASVDFLTISGVTSNLQY